MEGSHLFGEYGDEPFGRKHFETEWQKLAAFRREQKWPQNFRQARICYFRDKCVVWRIIANLQI